MRSEAPGTASAMRWRKHKADVSHYRDSGQIARAGVEDVTMTGPVAVFSL